MLYRILVAVLLALSIAACTDDDPVDDDAFGQQPDTTYTTVMMASE